MLFSKPRLLRKVIGWLGNGAQRNRKESSAQMREVRGEFGNFYKVMGLRFDYEIQGYYS